MEAIRVIGRIDLAQQVHAALVAAGAEAHLATAAPMAVIASTGRDGTGIDVLAHGFEVCPGIKKAAPDRPVLMITWDEQASVMAARVAKTARGPDIHIPWPATGEDILAACERAKETARVRRPRFTASILGYLVVVVVLLVSGGWVVLDLFRAMVDNMSGAASPHRANRWSQVWVHLVQIGVFVGSVRWSWARARTSSHPRWFRALAVFAALFAGVSFLGLVTFLLE